MDNAKEARAVEGGFDRDETPFGNRLPVRGLLATLFLLSSFPLGLLWLVVVAAPTLVGLPLTIVWVGFPLLALAVMACVVGTRFERRRLATLLGTRLVSPYRALPRGPVLARARARAEDPALWRGLLYVVLLIPIGLVELVVVLVPALGAFLVSYPLWFWTLRDGWGVGWTTLFLADTLPESLLVMLVGLVVVSATVVFAAQVSRAHASLGRALLGPRRRDGLDERVEELAASRSKAVEAAIAERRRIERDLHDGAQQRLVSLAMALGMAKEKLKEGPDGNLVADPGAARELVGEAHEEAKRALAEIRDLIRGIHPAVLTDRGLDAAVSALAGRSPVPTAVDVELDERPPEAAEITAYFVIAEALANVAKHSGASEARVLARREDHPAQNGGRPGHLLAVEVEDDGEGGADPEGPGLRGLADRAVVLDGRLTVESPAGGPTKVRAELPWVSQSGSRNGG